MLKYFCYSFYKFNPYIWLNIFFNNILLFYKELSINFIDSNNTNIKSVVVTIE